MLTRAGRGHDGDGLGDMARLHRSVRGLGEGGARGSGRLGAGGVMSRSRGGSGLGASRVTGRVSGRVSGRGSRGGAGGRPRSVALALVAGGRRRSVALALVAPFLNSRGTFRVDVVSTTSLHDTSEGRARKGEESQSVDHFERLKVFLCLIRKDFGNSNE